MKNEPVESGRRALSYVPQDLPMPAEIGEPAVKLLQIGLCSDDNYVRGRACRAFCTWMLLTAMYGARSYLESRKRRSPHGGTLAKRRVIQSQP